MNCLEEVTTMTSIFRLAILTSVLLLASGLVVAAEDRELYQQRLEAQRERQQQVNARNQQINAARSDLRSFAQELKLDYREQAKSVQTELELRKVDIKADHDARVADAEAEYQSKIMGVYMNPEAANSPRTAEQLSADTKAHTDLLFTLKKQYAEDLHAETIAIEKKKDALWTEMDQKVLDKAAALGLSGTYQPLLATPIGGELTTQEERWNEREKKAVMKHEEQNRKLLAEFRNGAKLRQWEMDNRDEDFRLTWEEKDKVHALDAEQKVLNPMLMGAGQGGQVDQQQWMKQIQEIGAEKRKINTEYRKIRDKNRIVRREQRKAILAE
jgi:hypothetical protein